MRLENPFCVATSPSDVYPFFSDGDSPYFNRTTYHLENFNAQTPSWYTAETDDLVRLACFLAGTINRLSGCAHLFTVANYTLLPQPDGCGCTWCVWYNRAFYPHFNRNFEVNGARQREFASARYHLDFLQRTLPVGRFFTHNLKLQQRVALASLEFIEWDEPQSEKLREVFPKEAIPHPILSIDWSRLSDEVTPLLRACLDDPAYLPSFGDWLEEQGHDEAAVRWAHAGQFGETWAALTTEVNEQENVKLKLNEEIFRRAGIKPRSTTNNFVIETTLRQYERATQPKHDPETTKRPRDPGPRP
jgi:hypothetical protein